MNEKLFLSQYVEFAQNLSVAIESILDSIQNNAWADVGPESRRSINSNFNPLKGDLVFVPASNIQESLGQHYQEALRKLGLEKELNMIDDILKEAFSIPNSIPYFDDGLPNLEALSQENRAQINNTKERLGALFLQSKGGNIKQLKITVFFKMLFFMEYLYKQSKTLQNNTENPYASLIFYMRHSSVENFQNLALFLFSNIYSDTYRVLLIEEGLSQNKNDEEILNKFKSLAFAYQKNENPLYPEPKKMQYKGIEKNSSYKTRNTSATEDAPTTIETSIVTSMI